MPILSLLPHKLLSSPPCPRGHIVLGLSPRANCSVTAPVKHLPQLTKLLTYFVRAHLPHLPFCSIAIRLGGKFQVHCDPSVAGLSVVFQDLDRLLVDFGFRTLRVKTSKSLRVISCQEFRLNFRMDRFSLMPGSLTVVVTHLVNLVIKPELALLSSY